MRGRPDAVKIYHVSSSDAWRTIVYERWRKGKGLRPALGLLFRFCKTIINQGLGGALSNFFHSNKTALVSYDEWLLLHDFPNQHANADDFIDNLDFQPLISILLPTRNSDLNFLTQAVESVTGQSYSNWQLCIADDASTDKDLKDYLKKLETNEKISIVGRNTNGHISRN